MIAVAGAVFQRAAQILGIKYYVSQQLAQMQAHHINKRSILKRAGKRGEKQYDVIAQIFKDYEDDIKFNDYCWVKLKDGELACINKDERICKTQRFGGIFPPIASIEKVLKPCTEKVETLGWRETWETKLKGYAKGYVSNLEYYVLQLEALLQDMALLKF